MEDLLPAEKFISYFVGLFPKVVVGALVNLVLTSQVNILLIRYGGEKLKK